MCQGGMGGELFRGGDTILAQYSSVKIGDYLFQMDLQGFHLSPLLVVGLHMLDCHGQCKRRQRIQEVVA